MAPVDFSEGRKLLEPKQVRAFDCIVDALKTAGDDGPRSVEPAAAAVADVVESLRREEDSEKDSLSRWAVVGRVVGAIPPGHPWHAAMARAVHKLEAPGTKSRHLGDLRDFIVDAHGAWEPSRSAPEPERSRQISEWKSRISWMAQLPESLFIDRFALLEMETSIVENVPDGDHTYDDHQLWGALEWLIHRSDSVMDLMNPEPDQAVRGSDPACHDAVVAPYGARMGKLCRDEGVSYPFSAARWNFWKRRLAEMAEEGNFDEDTAVRISKAREAMETAEESREARLARRAGAEASGDASSGDILEGVGRLAITPEAAFRSAPEYPFDPEEDEGVGDLEPSEPGTLFERQKGRRWSPI